MVMKKTSIKKWLAITLLTGMILSTAACAITTDDPQDDTQSGNTNIGSGTAVSETEEDTLSITLPDDLDYDGDEIVIISRDKEGWTRGEIWVESINSNAINDAVFERNLAVENRLNIKIVSVFDTDTGLNAPTNKVLLTVDAGTHEYDVMAAPCYGVMTHTLENNFVDLGDLLYLDLEQPWWCQSFNDLVEYKGSRYAVTGRGLITQYRYAFATLFNHRLFDDAQIAYPYEDVRNGAWTLDRQLSLVKEFHQDNGDGKADIDDDVFGLLTSSAIGVDPYWSSCKIDVIVKNTEGEYESAFDLAKLHSLTDKIIQLFHESDDATYVFPDEPENTEQEKLRAAFVAGNGAMATIRLMELESDVIRDMEDIYGVLPMPKYDEQQDDYYTYLHDQYTVFCIPTTIDEERAEEIGAFLEAFNYEGYRIVQPAYCETTLRTKLVQNPDSMEMMDEIIDGIRMEVGIIYAEDFRTYHNDLRQIVASENNTTSSAFSKFAQRLHDRYIPEFVEKWDELKSHS